VHRGFDREAAFFAKVRAVSTLVFSKPARIALSKAVSITTLSRISSGPKRTCFLGVRGAGDGSAGVSVRLMRVE
jgi:hypothetical protein